jgi:putative DNA primase/helicase
MRTATDATAAETVDPLALALGYAGMMGWHVLPLHTIRNGRCSCGTNCHSPGKHPISFLTPRGLKDATTDKAMIRRLWSQSGWSDANVGIATGRVSGLIVVDVDGAEGEHVLAEFEREHGALPETAMVITGKGRHLYFLYKSSDGPAIKNIANGSGLDIRGEGGYVVAAPSIHSSGKRYALEGGFPVAIAPETAAALREFIARYKPAKAEPAATPRAAVSPLGPVPDHLRTLALAAKRSGLNEAARVVSPPPPETPQEVERVRDALSVIPADDRDTWFRIGAALHSTKWKSWRQIWDEWSQTAPKKFNEEGQNKAAESFERGYDGARITLGTLFHLAKERGWIDPTPLATPASGSPVAPGAPIHPTQGRTIVNLANGQDAYIVDLCEQILADRKVQLYVRPWKNGMTFVTPHEKDVATVSGGRARQVRFQAHDVSSIEYVLGKHIDFMKKPWRGPPRHASPPKNICEMLCRKANGESLFPTIDGIICAPTLRMDGSLLDQPGYDGKTRLLLVLEDGFKMRPLPEAPTRDEALAALKLLNELLDEFPFEDGPNGVDRAVALSTLITPTLRGTMSIAPLHVIRARQAGTGKTFLVDVASLIATGEECASITAGKDEELTKQLISVIREGAPIISLDNCNHELDGEFLASMLSKTEVRARTLGRSEAPRYENKAMILANGNNISVAGDLVRRTIRCRLDAKRARPETREFGSNPQIKVRQDRAKYIRAILLIARAYRAACARGGGLNLQPLNNYEQWSEIVREPLIWLGCRDPVESQETVREEDPRENELLLLVTNWPHDHSRTKGGGLTARDLIDIASEMAGANADGPFKHQALRELLFRVAGRGREIDGNSLGQWLSGFEGHRVDSGQYITIKRNPKGHRYVLENG